MKEWTDKRRSRWVIFAAVCFVLGQLIPAVCTMIALAMRS